MKLLVIEDDPKIVDSISFAFQTGWPDSSIVSTDWGQEGIEMVESEEPDAVILDLGLPDMNGLDVLKNIRHFSDVPVLILSVSAEEMTVVQAFGLGAGDYVYKPFRPLELIARIKRLLLQKVETGSSTPLYWGSLFFDPVKREIDYKNKKVELRNIECVILEELIKRSPDVVSYNILAKAVWGDDYMSATDCLKVHIYNLRKKIELDPDKPKIIFNKSGTGYYALMPE